jgi:hypothetical protein
VAWETRRGRKYYYVSVRRGNCVRKRYLGHGDLAREAAKTIEAARVARAETAKRRAQAGRPIEEFAVQLSEFGSLIDKLLAGVLLDRGWRQHHRQWRAPTRGWDRNKR